MDWEKVGVILGRIIAVLIGVGIAKFCFWIKKKTSKKNKPTVN